MCLQIAMWGGYAPEAGSLQLRLSEAVGNQMRLVMWRWLLSAVTFGLDYCGAILNFVCVALPIATGKFLRLYTNYKHGLCTIHMYSCANHWNILTSEGQFAVIISIVNGRSRRFVSWPIQ